MMGGEMIVLASKSPIRASLLRQAGFLVETVPADVDERSLEAPWLAEGRSPAFVAEGLAIAKARSVAQTRLGHVVIGADQTLAVGDRRLSKVKDRQAAKGQIALLSGRDHALHSGFAVCRDGVVLASGVSSAILTMRALSEREIDAYLDAAGEAILGSVGCYQLEGLGVRLFERIEGDYFTILGLPMLALLAAMRGAGLVGGA